MDSEELRPDLAIPVWSHAGLISAGWRKSHSATCERSRERMRKNPPGWLFSNRQAAQRLVPKKVLLAPPCPQPQDSRPVRSCHRTPLASSAAGASFSIMPAASSALGVCQLMLPVSSASASEDHGPETLLLTLTTHEGSAQARADEGI